MLSAQVPSEFAQWNHYVDGAPTPDTYYRPEYATLYDENGDGRIVALVVATSANRFLLPLLLRPVPFSDRDEIDAITPYVAAGQPKGRCHRRERVGAQTAQPLP